MKYVCIFVLLFIRGNSLSENSDSEGMEKLVKTLMSDVENLKAENKVCN